MFKPTQYNAYYNPNFVVCYYIVQTKTEKTDWKATVPRTIQEPEWAIKADMVNGTTIIIGVYGDKLLAEKDLKGLIEQWHENRIHCLSCPLSVTQTGKDCRELTLEEIKKEVKKYDNIQNVWNTCNGNT